MKKKIDYIKKFFPNVSNETDNDKAFIVDVSKVMEDYLTDTFNDSAVRQKSLEMAIKVVGEAGGASTPDTVIEHAKKYYAYLKGEATNE